MCIKPDHITKMASMPIYSAKNTNFFCPVNVHSNSQVNGRCDSVIGSSPLKQLRQSKPKFMSSILRQGGEIVYTAQVT